MNETVSLFYGRLDRLDYGAARAELEAINEETQRLEFKEELAFQKVTKGVLALANAIGGVLVVGFVDPSEGNPLTPSGIGPKIDDSSRRGLMSRIQAKVYPALELEVWGYRAADGRHAMLVIRVPESRYAPHESLEERGRFPVRRGTQIDYLGLREIEQLLRRRDAVQHESASLVMAYPQITLDRNSADSFIGIRLSPERPSQTRVITTSLQTEIVDVVKKMPGLQGTTVKTFADGVLFIQEPDDPEFGAPEALERRRRRCYVRRDGAIEMRFPQDETMLAYQLYRIFGNAYAISSEVLQLLGAGPRVLGTFAYKLEPTPSLGPFRLATDAESALSVDFSQDSLVNMVTEPLLYAMRHGGETGDYDEFAVPIERFWRENYPFLLGSGDLRHKWR